LVKQGMTTEKALQWACSESWRVWLKVCVWRVDRDAVLDTAGDSASRNDM